jgi:hypothetical protein
MAMTLLRAALTTALSLGIWSCAGSSPIQPAATTKSAFEGAVYKGATVSVHPETPGNPTYRVFVQGGSGFVSMQSVRDEAEQRATEFCNRQGKTIQSITETTATPPHILGNFPRIEIVFDCIAKPESASSSSSDEKYKKLAELKQLLDSGAITQDEFNSEKAKILAKP